MMVAWMQRRVTLRRASPVGRGGLEAPGLRRVGTGWPKPIRFEQELTRPGSVQGLLENRGVVGLAISSRSTFVAQGTDGDKRRGDKGQEGDSGQEIKRHSSPPTLGYLGACQRNHYATTCCR